MSKPTQKQLLEKSREELKLAWHDKYPEGMFCLQLLKTGWRGLEADKWGMHWIPSRPTSHAIPYGVSAEITEGEEVRLRDYRGLSQGCTNFSSLADLLAAAKRRKCPSTLIEAFIDQLDTYHKIQLLK